MAQIVLNSAVAVLIALAFLTASTRTLRNQTQQVPAKIPPRRHSVGDHS